MWVTLLFFLPPILREVVLFQVLPIGALDVLYRHHSAVVFILRVLFAVVLVKVDVRENFDKVLHSMRQIADQFSVKVQNTCSFIVCLILFA